MQLNSSPSSAPPALPPLASTAVPQADDIDKVRQVVAAVGEGATSSAAIAIATGFSVRHVEYRLRAAVLLGLLREEGAGHAITAEGRSLLTTPPSSERERGMLRQLALQTAAVLQLAPDLFAPVGPTRATLATRIAEGTSLAPSTSNRRAGTLLAWRRRLQSRQLSLFPHLA